MSSAMTSTTTSTTPAMLPPMPQLQPPGLVTPNWPGLPAHIGAFTTTRVGGVSAPPFDDGQGGGGWNFGTRVGDDALAVAQNRRILTPYLPGSTGAPVCLHQVHGVVVLDAATVGTDETRQADASFTVQARVVCAVQTADCLPVLFCDHAGRVVAAAHAGWRGLAQGVLQATVAAMRRAGAGPISAWLGPAIGPQQFEVGSEVVAAFAHLAASRAAFAPHPQHAGKYLADIYQLARLALAQVEVLEVAGGEYCTVSQAQQFYSYRRDQQTGRMVSCIWIK
jgi:polyphenol oxidase